MSAEFGDLAGLGERRSLHPGDVLCEMGGVDTDVFQIISGSIDVLRATPEGDLVVATIGAGRLAGELPRKRKSAKRKRT